MQFNEKVRLSSSCNWLRVDSYDLLSRQSYERNDRYKYVTLMLRIDFALGVFFDPTNVFEIFIYKYPTGLYAFVHLDVSSGNWPPGGNFYTGLIIWDRLVLLTLINMILIILSHYYNSKFAVSDSIKRCSLYVELKLSTKYWLRSSELSDTIKSRNTV